MVLQLLAATEKTGQLEVRGEDEEHRGFLGVSEGRLVSAQYEDEDGDLALGAVFAIERGDFEFLPQDRVERSDLSGALEELIERARVERERVASIREAIPTDRMRFSLSARATERGEITLAPQQWRALLLVDGKRDVITIGQEIGLPRLAAQQLLASLVRAGLIDALPPPEDPSDAEAAAPRYRRLPPMQPIAPTTAGEQVVLRGSIPDFPLETIVQLLAETKKTGRLEVRAGQESSTLGVSRGELVFARSGEEEGELGLGAAFTAQEGEFDFVPMDEAPAANLSGALDPLLDRAAATRDRIVGIRAIIPNERARFTLSERATRNPEIVLTPEQWRVLLGVNGERDVIGIAEHLRMRRLPTMMVLADLVRGGYVDVTPAEERTWPYVERRRQPWPAAVTPALEASETSEPAPSPWAVATPAPFDEASAAAHEPIAEEPAAADEPITEEPAAEAEEPLADTPLDHAPETDDRLTALEGVFGQPEPAPPPQMWGPAPPAEESSLEAAAAEATAEALQHVTEPEPEPAPEPEADPEVDPRLAAFGAPPAEPEAAPSWEQPAPSPWATSSWAPPAPAEESQPEVDPRLAAFETSLPPAETPSWDAPAAETPTWETPAAPVWQKPEAPAEAPAEPEVADVAEVTEEEPPISWRERAQEMEAPRPPLPPPPPVSAPAPAAPEKKKGGLFGGLFGGGAKAAPAPAPAPARAATRAGQLASFANELVTAYNSGDYGKGRVEDRMLSLLMRADEQADPIDRPLPVASDRLDVAAIDRSAVPERQALPYLAVIVRQIYDDAERALGKEKARRGFRDVRERVFGRDTAVLQAREVSGRLPKV